MGNKLHNLIVSFKNFEKAEKLVKRGTSTQNSYRMGTRSLEGKDKGQGLRFERHKT